LLRKSVLPTRRSALLRGVRWKSSSPPRLTTTFILESDTMTAFRNIKGQTFGRLTARKFLGRDKKQIPIWRFRCTCGATKDAGSYRVVRGDTQSCGCLAKETSRARGKASKTHGLSKAPEYKIFREARRRCTDPNHDNYKSYGGRGIQFKFESFQQFYAELGPRPTPKHSVDRKNSHGHYETGNVRWATACQQCQNRPKIRTKCSSRFKGVSWKKKKRRWMVSIRVNGKQRHLGTFNSELEGALAYDQAARKHFGEFACPNFPTENAA
jgi:hypothetical protein